MTDPQVLRWRSSASRTGGAVVVVAIAAAALLLSRVDLALLALPIAAAVMLGFDLRPDPGATASAEIELSDSGRAQADFTLVVEAPERVEAIVLRYSLVTGEPRELVAVGPRTRLNGTVELLHSGPQELVRLEYGLLGPDGSVLSLPREPVVAVRTIEPGSTALPALPLPRRLQGLTGSHESARLGDGGDFRDIHPFTVGDRLRRIDWKATARRGQSPGDLYVRRTAALSDTTILLVLDSRDDVGEQVAEWRRNTAINKGLSSLDVAREAASSIAGAYINAGDRVGFQDLSSRRGMVAHAGGSRHLWRLLRRIESAAPSEVSFRHQRPPIVPPGALVYLLSSLLDDRSIQLALRWRADGHRVIAVDVLPAPRFDRTTRYERAAHRILMMERHDRIRLLQARGIELLRWSEEGERLPRQARLQILSRPGGGAGAIGGRR